MFPLLGLLPTVRWCHWSPWALFPWDLQPLHCFLFHLSSLKGFFGWQEQWPRQRLGSVPFFSGLPAASSLVTTPSVIEVALWYALVVSIVLWKFYRISGVVVVLSLLLLTASGLVRHLHLSPSGVQATVLDVGQGDATVIQLPRGTTMLIDGGGFFHHNFDTGKNIIAPFLLRNGIRRVDYIVMTHPHPDHYDGLRYIAKHFRPREFWTNGDTVNDPFFVRLQEVLKKRGLAARYMSADAAPLDIDGVTVRVLHPPKQESRPPDSRLNNRSLVIKLSFKDVSFLFAGDIHAWAEGALVGGREKLRAHVLKVPHHGSITSSTPGFIDAVKPRIAVCGDGASQPLQPAPLQGGLSL